MRRKKGLQVSSSSVSTGTTSQLVAASCSINNQTKANAQSTSAQTRNKQDRRLVGNKSHQKLVKLSRKRTKIKHQLTAMLFTIAVLNLALLPGLCPKGISEAFQVEGTTASRGSDESLTTPLILPNEDNATTETPQMSSTTTRQTDSSSTTEASPPDATPTSASSDDNDQGDRIDELSFTSSYQDSGFVSDSDYPLATSEPTPIVKSPTSSEDRANALDASPSPVLQDYPDDRNRVSLSGDAVRTSPRPGYLDSALLISARPAPEIDSVAGQLVRSRKSPDDSTILITSSSSEQGSSTPLRANSTSPPAIQTQMTPLDYDDFDLDYQLKLNPDQPQDRTLSSALVTTPASTATNMNKREYDNHIEAHPPPTPPWSTQLGREPSHLFNSTSGQKTPKVNSNNAPSNSNPQHIPPWQLYHNTPPIMPSLLTVKSAELTSQEMNKVRPHFLFYPDQYSEFGGPNSYHSAAEALANGDLLATASNSDLNMQMRHHQQALFSASDSNQAAGQPSNQTVVGLQNSRPPVSSANSSMISLLNGSPIMNKQSLLENLMQHHGQMGIKLAMPKSGATPTTTTSTQAPITAEDSRSWASSPSVTTIVVDNSVPTTEAPLNSSSTTTEAPSLLSLHKPTTITPTISTTTSRSTQSNWSNSAQTPALSSPINLTTSQAHQWFNYPHPNLHQNPLLLHHILNKPPSFYARNTAATQLATSTRAPTQSHQPPPVATAQPTNANQMHHQTQAANIIERPTLSVQPIQQQPVNLTLLQMQLNEMRSIAAAQTAQAVNPTNRHQNNWRQAQLRSPVNMLQHLVDGNISPASTGTHNLPPMQSQQLSPQVITVNHHHHHVARPQYLPVQGSFKSKSALSSQMIGTPSLLQEVLGPNQQQHLQHLQSMEDSLSVAASMNSGQAMGGLVKGNQQSQNETGVMNDEDMSTYVALLASLNAGQTTTRAKQAGGEQSLDQEQQLANLLDQLFSTEQANNTTDGSRQQALSKLQPGLNQLQMSHLDMQHNPQAQSWIELLKGAKLIGLSDEVQAQIYREHLAPLLAQSKLQSPPPSQVSQQLLAPGPNVLASVPAESSDSLITFVAAQMSAHNNQHQQEQLKGEPTKPLVNIHGLSDLTQGRSHVQNAIQDRQKQQEVLLDQRQRQVAFIEAIRSSLTQLQEVQAASGAGEPSAISANTSPIKDHKQTSIPGNSLESEFDESLANSSSQPMHQDGSNLHELARLPPASMQFDPNMLAQHPYLPTGWFPQSQLTRPPLSHMFARPASAMAGLLPRPPSSLAGIGSSPIPIYPMKSWWNARHHQKGVATLPGLSPGPQPRLLWPVQSQLQSHLVTGESAPLVTQQTFAAPVIRLSPPQPLRHRPVITQFQAPLQAPTMSLTPNRVMLDRFPLTAAPAYLIKLPTPTGGTITASGSLMSPPMPKFLRRPGSVQALHSIPPAAFISATPLGALRFLSALAPPRLRQPFLGSGPMSMQSSSSSSPLQASSSMLHVGHTAPAMSSMPPISYHPHHHPHSFHLHPVSHLHHHHHGPNMHYGASHPPPRQMQIYVGDSGNMPPESMASVQSSPDTTTTTTTTTISSGNSPATESTQIIQKQPSGESTDSDLQAPGSTVNMSTVARGNALTRLQQATASLVQLTSLASLLDEMVDGRGDSETSPTIALANAINSLSAAQNAAILSASQTSERIVPSSSSGSTSLAHFQQNQQQQLQVNQQQQQPGALFWRNLLVPGLLRQQGSKLLTSNKLRDFSSLERLLGRTQVIGSPSGLTQARLRVKYIRVPVAVYETTTTGAGGGSQTSSINLVNPNGSPGALLSSSSSTSTSGSTSSSGVQDDATLGSLGTTSNSDSISSDPAGTLRSGAGTSSSSSAAPSSNEYLFDEMSAESGAQTHYLQQQMAPALEDLTGLSFLPIVRAVNQKSPMADVSPNKLLMYPRPRPSDGLSSLESGDSYPVVSSPTAQNLLMTSDDQPQQRQKKKRKRKRKKNNNSDEEEEDDDDDEEDDDALSPNDLPIIESLISTIIHGPPQPSSAAPTSGFGAGWRSLRSGRNPFSSPASTAAEGRNRFVTMTPEASSSVYSYAHPGTGHAVMGLGHASASALGGHQQLLNPFKRQRFSLGEVVSALGAKKLISSLLGRRTKTARASKHKSTAAGPVKQHLLSPSKQQSSHDDVTTRMPPRDMLIFGSGINRKPTMSLFSRRRGHSSSLSKARRSGTTTPTSTTTSITTARPDTEIEPNQVTSRKPQPLVFPAIAAYDFDSTFRDHKRRRLSSTTRRPPPTTTRSSMGQDRGLDDSQKHLAALTTKPHDLLPLNSSSDTHQELTSTTRRQLVIVSKKRHKDPMRTEWTALGGHNATIIQLASDKSGLTAGPMPLYHIVTDQHKANAAGGQDDAQSRPLVGAPSSVLLPQQQQRPTEAQTTKPQSAKRPVSTKLKAPRRDQRSSEWR